MNSKIRQTKIALGPKRAPVAPVVYRPHPLPHVLQTKTSRAASALTSHRYGPASQQLPVHPSTRFTAPQVTTNVRAVQLGEANNGAPPPPPPPDPPAALVSAPKIKSLKRKATAEERQAKFGKDMKVAQDEQKQERAKVAHLRSKVDEFRKKLNRDEVDVTYGPSALYHGLDPIPTFLREFRAANNNRLEAAESADGRELTITVRMSGGRTVTGKYTDGTFKIFHCGEVSSGVGYGKYLGDV